MDAMQPGAKLLRAAFIQERTSLLGLRIPANSPYKRADELVRLKEALTAVGLRAKWYRYEEDLIAYIWFTSATPTQPLTDLIANYLTAQRLEVCADTLEVLTVGVAMPLPLQSGFAWINESGQTVIRREEIALQSAVVMFLADATKHTVVADEVIGLLHQQIDQSRSIEPVSKPILEYREDTLDPIDVVVSPDQDNSVLLVQNSPIGTASDFTPNYESATPLSDAFQFTSFAQPADETTTTVTERPLDETATTTSDLPTMSTRSAGVKRKHNRDQLNTQRKSQRPGQQDQPRQLRMPIQMLPARASPLFDSSKEPRGAPHPPADPLNRHPPYT